MDDTPLVMAIDQGTTSTRAIVFDHDLAIVGSAQLEHRQIFPRPGWVEHDPREIWDNTCRVAGEALEAAGIDGRRLAAVGVANQRETVVVWDRVTGEPVSNAIVWQDTRTRRLCEELAGERGPDRYRARVGLPLATYFAGPKVRWILDNVDGARARARAGRLLLGTIDTWLLWNLTGGTEGGLHVTDVTNASRTLLMNLDTLDWNREICEEMGIPLAMLPEIRSSAEVYGMADRHGPLAGVPVAGLLGDQQAATFGQACFATGMAKCTYGTGSFVLVNTGTTPAASTHGLLTTVCSKIGAAPAVYALEGAIAVTGSLVQWLRDNLGFFENAAEVEELALQVEDNGGAYLVPAFSGLFAPYWRADARGALVGLTRFVNRGHIARAALEATAYQTREVLEAMHADSGVEIAELRVDGGMVGNQTLMQFQADMLGVPVVRPRVTETTALGAAAAAGIATGFFSGEADVARAWRADRTWQPAMDAVRRDRLYRCWRKAVTRTFDWVDPDTEAGMTERR